MGPCPSSIGLLQFPVEVSSHILRLGADEDDFLHEATFLRRHTSQYLVYRPRRFAAVAGAVCKRWRDIVSSDVQLHLIEIGMGLRYAESDPAGMQLTSRFVEDTMEIIQGHSQGNCGVQFRLGTWPFSFVKDTPGLGADDATEETQNGNLLIIPTILDLLASCRDRLVALNIRCDDQNRRGRILQFIDQNPFFPMLVNLRLNFGIVDNEVWEGDEDLSELYVKPDFFLNTPNLRFTDIPWIFSDSITPEVVVNYSQLPSLPLSSLRLAFASGLLTQGEDTTWLAAKALISRCFSLTVLHFAEQKSTWLYQEDFFKEMASQVRLFTIRASSRTLHSIITSGAFYFRALIRLEIDLTDSLRFILAEELWSRAETSIPLPSLLVLTIRANHGPRIMAWIMASIKSANLEILDISGCECSVGKEDDPDNWPVPLGLHTLKQLIIRTPFNQSFLGYLQEVLVESLSLGGPARSGCRLIWSGAPIEYWPSTLQIQDAQYLVDLASGDFSNVKELHVRTNVSELLTMEVFTKVDMPRLQHLHIWTKRTELIQRFGKSLPDLRVFEKLLTWLEARRVKGVPLSVLTFDTRLSPQALIELKACVLEVKDGYHQEMLRARDDLQTY